MTHEMNDKKAAAVDAVRKRQDHIEFLEEFIAEITRKIDDLTDNRDFEKEIEALEFRIQVLSEADGKFPVRVDEFKKELKELRTKFDKIKPTLASLIEERAYYRHLQTHL